MNKGVMKWIDYHFHITPVGIRYLENLFDHDVSNGLQQDEDEFCMQIFTGEFDFQPLKSKASACDRPGLNSFAVTPALELKSFE